jgi:hypothetical protein
MKVTKNASLEHANETNPKVASATATPAVDPEIGGYFVKVTDTLGQEGLLIDPGTQNVDLGAAQEAARKAIGKRVAMWE